MMKGRFLFLTLVAAAVVCASCERAEFSANEQFAMDPSFEHGEIILGEKLNDPYTVANMNAALESLYPTKSGRTPLHATDFYVRFLPEDDAQYRRLDSLGVEMLDHPMDYQILREGDYYHDPSLGDEDITWQYAVVRKDFVFPDDIRYEILDECYLAEHAETKSSEIDWEAVEREAFVITGNGAMLPDGTKGMKSEMCPSGRIAIADSRYDGGRPFGVAGVTVVCNVFVKIATAKTDADGYYQMRRSFSMEPRYRLMFKNEKGFAIGFNWIIVPASLSSLGKDSPDGKSVVITNEDDKALFCRCVVNNAAYEYYESCLKATPNVPTPPSNLRIWIMYGLDCSSAPMLHQGVFIDGELMSKFMKGYNWIVKMFLPDVTIGVSNYDSYYQVYAATIHELSHASHFERVGKEYWETLVRYVMKSFLTCDGVAYGNRNEENSGVCAVCEMWAYYCETRFFRHRYGSSQAARGTTHWFHPQIFLNLDSRGIGWSQIYRSLDRDITDIESLRSNLISLYPGSRLEINQAFDRYE